MTPRRGILFKHSRLLNPDNTPMVMRVMEISDSDITYRPVDGGAPLWCPLLQFPRYCLEEVLDPRDFAGYSRSK